MTGLEVSASTTGEASSDTACIGAARMAVSVALAATLRASEASSLKSSITHGSCGKLEVPC